MFHPHQAQSTHAKPKTAQNNQLMHALTPYLEGRQKTNSPVAQTAIHTLGTVGHLYGAIQGIRASLYQRNLLKSYRPPCPVISVGNLSAGGTGKTPMVLWLAEQLLARTKKHPKSGPLAIVSRGYGVAVSHTTGPTNQENEERGITIVADPDGLKLTPPQAADEAVLLARRLPGVVVLTGADRAQLCRFAVQQYGCQWILMDDAFQHMRVQRDLNLVLVDAQKPFGNGYLLPGGILREYPSALKRADAICITRANDYQQLQITKKQLQKIAPTTPLFHAQHQATAWVSLRGADEPDEPEETTTIQPNLTSLADKPVLAFCGIARPDTFTQMLANLKINNQHTKRFPDHFAYRQHDLKQLIQHAKAHHAEALVCTEKDAVKIDRSWLNSESPRLPLFYLRMALVFPQPPIWIEQQLDRMVNNFYTSA